MDAVVQVELLPLTDLGGIGIAVQHRAGLLHVQPRLRHRRQQHLAVLGALALGEIGAQQRFLQGVLARRVLQLRPMQQPVGVERVVDPAAALFAEGESHAFTTLADRLARDSLLFGRGAVLLREMFGDVLAAGRHLRIELERLEVQFRPHVALQIVEGLFQRGQPDGAPGAGDVGDEIDLEMGGHGPMLLAFGHPCSQPWFSRVRAAGPAPPAAPAR